MVVQKVPTTMINGAIGGSSTYFFPETYGAVGDGVANDTAAIQLAINAAKAAGGGDVFFTAGKTYATVGGLIHRSGVRLVGYGSTLKALASWPIGSTLIQNETTSGPNDVWTDVNMAIEGLTIDGNNVTRDIQSAVAYIRCENLSITNIKLINVRYMGLAIAGCKSVKISGGEYINCGKANPPVDPGSGYAEGGASIWFGNAGTTYNYDVRIVENVFRDNLWSALYLNNIMGIVVSENTFRNNGESTIFMNSTTRGFSITANTFISAILKHISAHSIELGGNLGSVCNNNIEGPDGCGITCTDSVGVTIAGNTISNVGQSASLPQSAGVLVISSLAAPNNPKAIQISGNVIQSQDGKAYTAIYGSRKSGAGPLNTVLQTGNNTLNGTWTSGSAVIGI